MKAIFMKRIDNHRSHIRGFRRCIGSKNWRKRFEIIAESQIKRLSKELVKRN
jgi:hypothetical protein